ncbi:hypothetical protein [Grimontia marina]|uniref:Phage shock protein B n=1 Tax=Grimontia marina TaxID=646534 RepID=A0A128FC04_9GAMM|nr:hypothetical protein [Grimontia marina]CZF84020.1 hypothetical protein GMA8713_02912 [Grimontia marina]
MDVLLSVIIIVALVVGTRTLKSYFAYRAQVREFEANKVAEGSGELVAEIDALKNRIEVLEKLVTDQGYELDKKIRAL